MGKQYASKLTREDLENCGITIVTEEGRIFRGENEVPVNKTGIKGYLSVNIYNKVTKKYIMLGVHVANYIWHYGERPAGYVVDHIDNDCNNNHLSNLQLLTPADNINKERGGKYSENGSLRKLCHTNSYEQIVNKIEKYNRLNEIAKANHDAEGTHRARASLVIWKSKLQQFNRIYKGENE